MGRPVSAAVHGLRLLACAALSLFAVVSLARPETASNPAPPALVRAAADLEAGHAEAVLEKTGPTSDAAREATASLDKAKLHALRGAAFDRLKHPDDAAAEFQAASDALTGDHAVSMQLRLLVTGGMVLLKVGKPEADAVFRQALALVGAASAGDDDAVDTLADAAFRLNDVARRDMANEFAGAALALARRIVPDSSRLARALLIKGIVETDLMADANAEMHFAEALRLRERLNPGSSDLATVLQNFGYWRLRQGKPQEGARYFERAIALWDALGATPLGLHYALRQLAEARADLDDVVGAKTQWLRDIELLERLAPQSQPLAEALGSLGTLERRANELDAARAHLSAALAIMRQLGGLGAEEADLLELLAETRAVAGDLAGAEQDRRDAVAIRRREQPGTPQLAASLDALGATLRARGAEREATTFGTEAQELRGRLGARHTAVLAEMARTQSELEAAFRAGKLSEVLERSEAALDAARQAQDATGQARVLAMRGMALRNLGHHQDAARAFTEVAAVLARVGNGPDRIAALGETALSLLDAGAGEAAMVPLQEAERVGESETRSPIDAASSLYEIGRMLTRRGRETLARPLVETAVDLARRSSPGSPALANDLVLLGVIEDKVGNGPARDHLAEALAIREALDENSADTAIVLYDLAQDDETAGDRALALRRYRRAAQIIDTLDKDPDLLGRILKRLGETALDLGDLAAAQDSLPRAVPLIRNVAPGSPALAEVLNNLGSLRTKQGNFAEAAQDLHEAAEILEHVDPTARNLVAIYRNLASLARHDRQFVPARDYNERALNIEQHYDPDGRTVLEILVTLGDDAQEAGDLPGLLTYRQHRVDILAPRQPDSKALAGSILALAAALNRAGHGIEADAKTNEAIAIVRKIDGDTLPVASLLAQLGAAQHDRGDFAAARQNLEEALRIAERLAPNGPESRQVLLALAHTALASGDFETARRLVGQVEAIERAVGAPAAETITGINQLGRIAFEEGDYGLAGDYYNRALDIERTEHVVSEETGETLNGLGLIALASTSVVSPQRGDDTDLELAESRFREANAIMTKLDPQSMNTMQTLQNLGVVLGRRGKLAEAEASMKKVLAMVEKWPSVYSPLPKLLLNLGTFIGTDVHRRDEALDYLRRAVAAQERLAPNTLEMALALDAEAYCSQDRDERERLRQRAYDIVRARASSLVTDESRQHFAPLLAFYTMELVRAQIALGRWGDAFITSESGRAFALQQLIAEHSTSSDVHPGAQQGHGAEPLAERTQRDTELRAAEERLDLLRFKSNDPTALATAEAAVAVARAAYLDAQHDSDTRATTAGTSPVSEDRLPMDQAEVGRILGSDTVYLSFSWDQRGIIWFLVYRNEQGTVLADPGGLVSGDDDGVFMMASMLRMRSAGVERGFMAMQMGHSQSPPTGAFATDPDIVAKSLEEFRRTVTDYRNDMDQVTEAGRTAFELMFPSPARQIILSAKHLLIALDGPLWDVPFAALVVNDSGPPDYLGDHVAITYTQSLRLYEDARASKPRRMSDQQPRALVVGDPQFPQQSATASCNEADRLCASGDEARSIAALYGGTALTRTDATKAAVLERIGDADVIHLATHAVLDPRIAMASSIRLAAPLASTSEVAGGTDGGLLHAWEVLGLRLRAELVVLSGCETALGDHGRAAGMVGLTRAFQAAGARSVVASQWRVEDEGTAALMEAFHDLLRRGIAKDAALQQAMREARKERPLPFYWASFVLLGDPRNLGLGAAGTVDPAPALH